MDVDDWRIHLSARSRERILDKIFETLRRVAPHRPDEFEEVKRIAARFEGNVYNSATSQSDYLRRISLKMLAASSRNFRSGSSTPATATGTTTSTTTTAASASTSAITTATATITTTADANESPVTRSGKPPHQISSFFFYPTVETQKL
ncbi:hypothetical protein MKW94_024749 [Papaver nudicaule]|uniref:Mediator complex subunit 15 KIX domain-containing protein n=1 Tax=Papaver nudicaule TaxID=74823 RepID=A0AA41SNT6_PAPNU|nr:hypothetical protein [Papaver nudicaule]